MLEGMSAWTSCAGTSVTLSFLRPRSTFTWVTLSFGVAMGVSLMLSNTHLYARMVSLNAVLPPEYVRFFQPSAPWIMMVRYVYPFWDA